MIKSTWLASILLGSAAGFALAGTGSHDDGKAKAPECQAAAKSGECPASALVVKWEKAAAQLAAMPAEKREAVERATATLSGACPVCKEAPASFAFLGRFIGSNVAFDKLILASCEAESKSKGHEDIPAEIRTAFESRVAIGATSNDLFTAFAKATAHPGKGECAETGKAAPASLTLVDAAKTFESITEEATRLATNWNGVPARAAALPAEKKAELLAAMDVLKREVPTCELWDETMSVLSGGFDRLVSIDKTLSAHCEAVSKEHAGELPPEHAQFKNAAQARAAATAKVADLLRLMKKSMTPDIFKAQPAVAGTGQ